MKTISLLFLLAALPAYAQSDIPVIPAIPVVPDIPVTSEITGTVHVIDGSTIHVNNARATVKVRLLGIAAPAIQEEGGKEAAAVLSKVGENKPVRCVLEGKKIQNLEAGICYVDGKDIAAAVVRAGLARDCPALSNGRYWAIERPEAQKLLLPDYCQ